MAFGTFHTAYYCCLLHGSNSLGCRGTGKRQRPALDDEFLQFARVIDTGADDGAVGVSGELKGSVPRKRRGEDTPQVVAFRSARTGGVSSDFQNRNGLPWPRIE